MVRRPSEEVGHEQEPALPPRLTDIGLPVGKGTRIQSVTFNEAAATLVAVLQPINVINSSDQRVFVRALGESHYRELELPDPLASVGDCCVCAGAPVALLNIVKWTGPDRRAANNLGLYRVSLPDGRLERLPAPMDPITAPEEISVNTILGASPDGTELHLIISRPIYVRISPALGHRMGFFVAKYAVASGTVSMMDELPAVFA